jgi:thiamine-phosphate pyrophosphorylase
MSLKLPRLYAIADRATLDKRGVSVGEFARELRDAGVTLLQYRDKDGGPQEVLRAAAEISAVFVGVEATLVMNDRADLAVLAGWGAVHVGQGDLSVADAKVVLCTIPHPSQEREGWATRDRVGIVGVSTHNEGQWLALTPRAENPDLWPDSGPDYVAVGPVFATGTKLNAEPVVGLEGVRAARRLTVKPLVAIGGITLENARSVVDAGADSVAVIGGLFVDGRTVGEVARDFLARLR